MSERSDKAGREFTETEAAFDGVRDALIARLLDTTIGESLMRDKIVLTIQALGHVRQTVLAVAQDGDIERHVEALQEALKIPA